MTDPAFVAKRVEALIARQMQSQQEEGEYPVTLELVDIIRRHGPDAVLDPIKVNLKHGQPTLQLRALSILNQCVLCSGPDVAIALSTEKWGERFYMIAKTTKHPQIRERLIRQLLQWYQRHRTNGLEQCLGRFSQSKSLKDDFVKVSQELASANEDQPNSNSRPLQRSTTPPASPLHSDPNGSITTQVQRNRSQTTAAVQGMNRAQTNQNQNIQRQREAILAQARDQTRLANASQQQQGTAPRPAAGTAAGGVANLSNLETFIMDAQGDLASLEYGLSHPEILDGNTARDCKKHKLQVGRILQMEFDLPSQYLEALMRLLENLSNALEVYEMFSGEDLGEGGLSRLKSLNQAGFSGPAAARRHLQRTRPVSSDTPATPAKSSTSATPAASPSRESDDDDDVELPAGSVRMGGIVVDPSSAERQAVEAQQEAMRMIEQERAELAQARQELSTIRSQNEELQTKYKDAKTKNKKALTMLTEHSNLIEELEARVAELQGGEGGATKTGGTSPQRPTIVEKVIVSKPKVSRDVLDRIRHDIFAVKEDLRKVRGETLADWRRDFHMLCTQVQGSVAGIVVAAQRERAADNKALQWAQELYKKELKLRKQYYNQIQELKGNIRVYCRVRPMSERELGDGHSCVVSFPSEDELRIIDPSNGGRTKVFEFDTVFAPDTTQEKVFEDTAPLIDSVVDGFNVCIFAYGQTGSGKTFTMNGPSSNKGINRRALDRLFQIINERSESEESTVSVSVLEIYCEQIRDLLVSKSEANRLTYDVKTGGAYGNYVTNLAEVPVQSSAEIDEVMDRAAANRSEGRTDMNAHSSRSHMILYVLVKTRNIQTGVQSYGKLSLVDLAGSERLDKSGSEGQAAKEAVAINKSLSALGDVIAGLSNTGQKHIPFRNSILTFLLQDSMAGQAKVLMFCNISPASYNVSESSSSLQFATRARGVSLGQAKRNVVS